MRNPRVRGARAASPADDHAADGSRALARTRLALLGLFTLNGLMFSSWLARIPAVRDALDLTAGQLGLVLLAGSVGALATATVSGIVVTRFGGRVSLLLSTVGFAAAYVLIGVGPTVGSVPLLAAGIFLNGVSFALGNVPLNVETAAVERRMGRTVLPQFHAAFSIGAVLGSLIGALASSLAVPILGQFIVTAAIGTAWRLASLPHAVLEPSPARVVAAEVLPEPADHSAPARRRAIGSALDAWREPRTLLIGVVIMAAALSEGSANDWLALAVVDGFDQTEAVGAVVFGLFVGAMTAVRLLGTRLIDRLGRVPVLRASGCVSLAGLLLFGFAPTFETAVIGVAAWGFGAALAVPLGIAAASDDPMLAAGRVAVVSAFSSVASIAAPPLLGLAADSMGARRALTLIAVAMVASIALSRRVAPLAPSATLAPSAVRAPGAASLHADAPGSVPTPGVPIARAADGAALPPGATPDLAPREPAAVGCPERP